MKKLITLFVLLTFLASCGKTSEVITKAEKKDFYVEVQDLGSSGASGYIEKIGRVSSSQDISLSAQANGRVSSISVKAGDSVTKGRTLAFLSDSIGSYEINLQRASIGIERAEINYDSTELSLDKQIFDAKLNLEKLQRNLVTLRLDAEKNIALGQDALSNTEYTNLDSKAALQIEQLNNNIEKSKLDYDIKVSSDIQQIENFKALAKKEFTNIRTLIFDVIDFSDSILGVTPVNSNKNDDFEDFLGARDKTQKNISELELEKLIQISQSDEYLDTVALMSEDISQDQIGEIADIIFDAYEAMLSVLIELETTLNNSIESVGTLGASEISAYISQINAFQNQIQGNYSGFISFRSTVNTFLSTYKDSQESILKAIELQEKDRDIQLKNFTSGQYSAELGLERTVLSIEDNIKNLEDQIISAKKTLENAEKNKEITLRSLQNSLADSRVSYSSALKEYNKLVITSPINGTIADVLVDVGQEIFSGVTLFSIVSNGTPELEIALSDKERKLVNKGDAITIITADGKELQGDIYSISDVADENLNYISTIVFEGLENSIGSLVTVRIPTQRGIISLPINAISTVGDDIGIVQTLSGSSIVDVRVRLGDVMGEEIEIISCAKNCVDLQVIVSDVSAYNENNFILKQK